MSDQSNRDSDEIKKIEQRAYARGYLAGKKSVARKAQAERHQQRIYAQNVAFLHRAFLAALPACIAASGWKNSKGEPITSSSDRVRLAWNIAEESLKQQRFP